MAYDRSPCCWGLIMGQLARIRPDRRRTANGFPSAREPRARIHRLGASRARLLAKFGAGSTKSPPHLSLSRPCSVEVTKDRTSGDLPFTDVLQRALVAPPRRAPFERQERRRAEDGREYTFQQYLDYFDDRARALEGWESASRSYR